MYPIGTFKKIIFSELNSEQKEIISKFLFGCRNNYIKFNVIENCKCSKCFHRNENILVVLKIPEIKKEKQYLCLNCYVKLKKELGLYPKLKMELIE